MKLPSLSTFFGPRHGKRLGMALAGLLAGLTAGCGQPTEAEFIANAKRFQESGKLQASVIELKNALGKNPDNPEARRLLGLVMLQLGNAPVAEKELKRAMELGMEPATVLLPLTEAFLRQGKFADIQELSEPPESLSAADRATFLAYRGDAWRGTMNPDRAKADYAKALAVDSRSSRAKAGLAHLAVANRDFAEAHRLIAEALETDPENGSLWRFQAQLFYEQRKPAEAESSFSKAIEKNRANEIDRAMRAIIRMELKRVDDANRDIAELKAKAPRSPATHYAAGVLAFMEDRLPEALTELEQAHRANEEFAPTLFFLGSTKFRLGQLEQADHLISRYLSADPGSVKGISMLALIKFNEKNYEKARDLLDSILNQVQKKDFPLALLGLSEFALGRTEEGLKHFKSAVELAAPPPENLKSLSTENRAAGAMESGADQQAVSNAVEVDYFPTTLSAILAHVKSGQMDKAQDLAKAMKEKMKESPLPENLLRIIARLQSGPRR